MKSSQFMDKQVMGLSGSEKSDFFELLNPPQEEHNEGGIKRDGILPSYDFHPSIGSLGGVSAAGSLTNTSGIRTYGSLVSHESAKVTLEKDRASYDSTTVSEIDRTMKKHVDNLLHAMEGVSARLSQLETRTHHLDSSVDDLKVTVGNNNGSTDGKLRQLENMLREVQTGVQVLRDKQEIAETKLQLCKLQASSKADQTIENPNTTQADSLQQASATSKQSLPPPTAVLQPSPLPALSLPNAPPPLPQQNPPPVQLPTQLPSNQMPPPPVPSLPREQYYSHPGQSLEPTHQQYQIPAQQPQPTPHQQYQAPMQVPQYSQPGQPPQQHQPHGSMNPPQFRPPVSHHPEENSNMPPPPTYPSSIRPPTSLSQPPTGSPSTQQFYGSNSPHMYEPSGNRPGPGQQLPLPAGYGPPSGPSFNDPYPYSGSPSHYSGSSMRPAQHSSPSAPTSGSNYSRLPTAQVLPHALPTATSVSSDSSSGGTGNRVPIDDVVDKVTMMGFSRDQVRATVRRLTENGQSVDLNVVLDKLMNGGEVQPQKGWFGR